MTTQIEPIYYLVADDYTALPTYERTVAETPEKLTFMERPSANLLAQFIMDSFNEADGRFSADDIKYWTDVLTAMGPDWASRIYLMISKMKWVA